MSPAPQRHLQHRLKLLRGPSCKRTTSHACTQAALPTSNEAQHCTNIGCSRPVASMSVTKRSTCIAVGLVTSARPPMFATCSWTSLSSLFMIWTAFLREDRLPPAVTGRFSRLRCREKGKGTQSQLGTDFGFRVMYNEQGNI